MVSSPSIATQRVRVFFAKTHSALYRSLSLNVLREVCSYIDSLIIPAIPSIPDSKVILHNLGDRTQRQIELSERLSSGVTYCALDKFTLFGVGGTQVKRIAKRIDLLSGTVADEPLMKSTRIWAGIILFDSNVLIFGGLSTGGMLTLCEAFSLVKREWAHYPDMMTAKAWFTPVEHHREIYLPAPKQREQQLEVFTPETLQYRLLPLRLHQSGYASVSFIYAEELFIVTQSRKIMAWVVDSHESEARSVGEFRNDKNAFCSGSTVLFGNCVYWPNSSGSLVMFDLKNKVLSEPKPE